MANKKLPNLIWFLFALVMVIIGSYDFYTTTNINTKIISAISTAIFIGILFFHFFLLIDKERGD